MLTILMEKAGKVLSNKRAHEIIGNFSHAAVLVIGDIMIDHFIWGKVSRISPEAPVPVVDVQTENLMLGGCANVLNNIHAIGGKVLGAGVVGDDEVGKKVLSEFQKRKIDTSGVVVEHNRPTTMKTRIVAHGQQVVRFDRESKMSVREESIQQIIAYIKGVCDQVGAIVISDYNKGVVTESLIEGIRRIVAGRKVFVCVDPKRDDFSFYRGFDIITPNHQEACRAVSMDISTADELYAAGEMILKQFDFKAALITKGEEGISLFEQNGHRITHTPFHAQAKEVFDVTGAGDTVIAVFALSLSAGAHVKEATALANIAAGIAVGKVGTATVSLEELTKSL